MTKQLLSEYCVIKVNTSELKKPFIYCFSFKTSSVYFASYSPNCLSEKDLEVYSSVFNLTTENM